MRGSCSALTRGHEWSEHRFTRNQFFEERMLSEKKTESALTA
jgi:hypothetical protein